MGIVHERADFLVAKPMQSSPAFAFIIFQSVFNNIDLARVDSDQSDLSKLNHQSLWHYGGNNGRKIDNGANPDFAELWSFIFNQDEILLPICLSQSQPLF